MLPVLILRYNYTVLHPFMKQLEGATFNDLQLYFLSKVYTSCTILVAPVNNALSCNVAANKVRFGDAMALSYYRCSQNWSERSELKNQRSRAADFTDMLFPVPRSSQPSRVTCVTSLRSRIITRLSNNWVSSVRVTMD